MQKMKYTTLTILFKRFAKGSLRMVSIKTFCALLMSSFALSVWADNPMYIRSISDVDTQNFQTKNKAVKQALKDHGGNVLSVHPTKDPEGNEILQVKILKNGQVQIVNVKAE